MANNLQTYHGVAILMSACQNGETKSGFVKVQPKKGYGSWAVPRSNPGLTAVKCRTRKFRKWNQNPLDMESEPPGMKCKPW